MSRTCLSVCNMMRDMDHATEKNKLIDYLSTFYLARYENVHRPVSPARPGPRVSAAAAGVDWSESAPGPTRFVVWARSARGKRTCPPAFIRSRRLNNHRLSSPHGSRCTVLQCAPLIHRCVLA